MGKIFDGNLLVSPSANPCTGCPAGTYREHNRTETASDNVCANCEKGKSSVVSSSTCTFCPAGKVWRQEGELSFPFSFSFCHSFANDIIAQKRTIYCPLVFRSRCLHRLQPRLLLFARGILRRMHVLPKGQVHPRFRLVNLPRLPSGPLRRKGGTEQ